MTTGTREELDRDELNGDGDEGGARRGGRLRTCVHMLLGAVLPSHPQPWARARIRPPCARPRLGRAGDSLTDCKGGP
jgi:hypothetical protein